MIIPVNHLRKNALEKKNKDHTKSLTKEEDIERQLCMALGLFKGTDKFIDLLRNEPVERCEPMLKWREWVAPLRRSWMIHLWQNDKLELCDAQQLLLTKKSSANNSPDLEIFSRFIECLETVEALEPFSRHMDVFDVAIQKEKDRAEKKNNISDEEVLRIRSLNPIVLRENRTEVYKATLMFDPKKSHETEVIDSDILHFVKHFRNLIGESKKNVTVFRKVAEYMGLVFQPYRGRTVRYCLLFQKEFFDLFEHMDYEKIYQRLHVVTKEGRQVHHTLYHNRAEMSSMTKTAYEIEQNNTFNEKRRNELALASKKKDEMISKQANDIAELKRQLDELLGEKRNRQDDQVQSSSPKRHRSVSTSSLEQVRSKKRRKVSKANEVDQIRSESKERKTSRGFKRIDLNESNKDSEMDNVKNAIASMRVYRDSNSTLLRKL